MGWTNTSLDEIVAPSTTPFVPGNNVTGFGSQVPSELSAAGFANAMVFYASDWDPAATTRRIKFRFIAANSEGLILGYGYCANPSVSQTATVVKAEVLSTFDSDTGTNSSVVFQNKEGIKTYQFLDFGGGPSLFITNDSNNRVVALNAGLNDESDIVLGTNPGVTLSHLSGGTVLRTDSHITREDGWNSFTFSNSWSDNTFARYRLMPDGTVMFRGIITKVANPANGEVIITGLPVGYRPAQRSNFLCPCSGRAYNGAQKIEVQTDGTVKIWDMAAAGGDVCLDPIRYPVIL